MAKNDTGYTKRRGGGGGGYGGGGRRKTINTWIAQTPKDSIKQYLIREVVKERLEALGGVPPQSELGLSVRQSVTDEIKNGEGIGEGTKNDIGMEWFEKQRGGSPLRLNQNKVQKIQEAEILLEALYSYTKAKERENLDEGDFLDDPASAIIDGSGWGEEVVGKLEYRKHVNICIDNSGSTHIDTTGFCGRVLNEVSENLIGILKTASQKYEGITWGVFDFNRVAKCGLFFGREWVDEFQYLSDVSGTSYFIDDPLKRDAEKTNLAPLMEEIYNKEQEHGLTGEPRLDIILTDGEFESQKDADEAIEWQRKRGGNIFTYVLNVCPEIPSDIKLPPQFRIIPVGTITESDQIKQVDANVLINVLYSIVIDEMTKGS